MQVRHPEGWPRWLARMRWAIACGVGLLAWLAVHPVTPHSARASRPASAAGVVHFMGTEADGFDSTSRLPRARMRAFLASHMTRMLVYPPSFDPQTAWYERGWIYQDAYAIYPDAAAARYHSRWILRDRSGRRLYIPFACAHGSCPQYAGNIADPSFRRHIIDIVRSRLREARYRGVFMDDVNLSEQVSDGRGNPVLPFDPMTHRPLGAAAWRSAMASFMAEIRAALPGVEITHNVIWFAAGTDAAADREISAADYINLERGANDAALTGVGRFALTALLAFADRVHARGRHVILEGTAADVAGMTYNLASYFLISDGGDLVRSPGLDTGRWWSGLNAVLGSARGARHAWRGMLRRDFSAGLVLLDPPGAADRTVLLSRPLRSLADSEVRRLTLHAGSAAILRGPPDVRLTIAQP